MKYSAIVLFVLFVGVITFQNLSGGNLPSWGKTNPYLVRFLPPVKPKISRDTLPAIKERKDNFSIAKPVNIIDLKDPSIIDKKVTYDPITNKYIMTEKIGEDDFQYPSYMSFDQYLKKREVEDYQKYFKSEEDVPYMNQVVQVISQTPIPSVTHVDNSARIQTVKREDNPLYYELLKEFEKLTGTPILLNTSFNLKDHTMTNDPQKAIWTFLNCDMDYLVLGKYLISK